MDDSLYDEFGNYLGPDLEDDDEEDLDMEEEQEDEEEEEQPIDHETATADEASLMQLDGKQETCVDVFCIYIKIRVRFFIRYSC